MPDLTCCGLTFPTRAAFSQHLLVHSVDAREAAWKLAIGPNKAYRGSRDEAHAERLKDARARREAERA